MVVESPSVKHIGVIDRQLNDVHAHSTSLMASTRLHEQLRKHIEAMQNPDYESIGSFGTFISSYGSSLDKCCQINALMAYLCGATFVFERLIEQKPGDSSASETMALLHSLLERFMDICERRSTMNEDSPHELQSLLWQFGSCVKRYAPLYLENVALLAFPYDERAQVLFCHDITLGLSPDEQ